VADEDVALPDNTLPPRAGQGTFLGLSTSDWLATLGGLLQGIPAGRGPVGSQIHPFQALFPLAQGFQNYDQRQRQQQTIKDLDTQYGDQDIPEFQTARMLAQQGDMTGAMRILSNAITNRNTQAREAQRAHRAGAASTALAGLFGDVQVPQIARLAEMAPEDTAIGATPGTGDVLTPPPPVKDFTAISRPRTTDEFVKGLQALPVGVRDIASENARAFLEKRSEKDTQRAQDLADSRAAIAQLGGPKGLYDASPDALEAAALTLAPGTKFGAQLGVIAAHKRAGNAEAARLAAQETNRQFQHHLLTGQTEFIQNYKTSEAERKSQEAADRLQLGRDTLDAKINEWAARAGERNAKLGATDQKTVSMLAGLDNWLNQSEQAWEGMRAANLLPTGTGGAAWLTGLMRRHLTNREADALRVWNALQPGVVGLDRAVLGDVGVRAQAAYQGSLNVFNSPPNYEAGKKIFANMREQIDTAKANTPAILQAARIRAELGTEGPTKIPGRPETPSPAPARPAAPPKPEEPISGVTPGGTTWQERQQLSRQDPRYKAAQKRGISDAELQSKYKLDLVR
jgi:hypothetical protein